MSANVNLAVTCASATLRRGAASAAGLATRAGSAPTRVPLIKFRHGPGHASGAHAAAHARVGHFPPPAPASASSSTAGVAPAAVPAKAATGSTLGRRVWVPLPSKATLRPEDLPELFGRPALSQAEMDAVRYGSAL